MCLEFNWEEELPLLAEDCNEVKKFVIERFAKSDLPNDFFVQQFDLSEVKTLFLKNKILNKITLNFENVDDFKIPGKDLLNRTIMGLNMNINTDGRYEFSLETYDCTPSSTDIFDCVILNFKCYNLCILDED